jgi:hypothetical protein
MLITKLEYIHRNPCEGEWSLVEDYARYKYSSALLYERGEVDKLLTDYRGIY